MSIKFEKPERTENEGQKWRKCVLCGRETESSSSHARLYPENMMVESDKGWMCQIHYEWYYGHKRIDESDIDVSEDDREG